MAAYLLTGLIENITNSGKLDLELELSSAKLGLSYIEFVKADVEHVWLLRG